MSNKYANMKKQLDRAFIKFQEVLREKENDIVRDSAIQRFEFTFELAWKTLKNYLEEKKGAHDLYYPKDIFRSAFQAGLIDDSPVWLEMVDTRNKTSHLYNEKMAEDVYKVLPKYVPLINRLIEAMA